MPITINAQDAATYLRWISADGHLDLRQYVVIAGGEVLHLCRTKAAAEQVAVNTPGATVAAVPFDWEVTCGH